MNYDATQFQAMDEKTKREILARLLRQRASGEGEPFSLSVGQEALWFLHELAPDSAAYNVHFCARVRSEVDRARLEHALLKLIERHSMLRCTIIRSAHGPRQRIGPVPERCLEIVDASGVEEEELKVRVEQACARPFDLTAEPGLRCTLFSRCATEHVLLLSVHHVFCDAWSFGILVNDLMTLYEKGANALAPLPATAYADYVKWQRATLDSPEGREAWEYWQPRLKDLPSSRLPADYPRPKMQSFRGASHYFELPTQLCDAIRGLARTHNATPFMVLAAAFHGLLVRYCGSSSVPIGTPLSGRSRREDEGTVGYFINPVVLCVPVLPGMTFREHLADVRAAAIEAQRFGEFPFPEIVKRCQPARDTSEMPIFQVTLNLVKASQVAIYKDMAHADAQVRVGSLVFQAFPLNQQEGQFDLDLDLFDTGSSMPATFKYRTDLFERATIERLTGHFLTLLNAAVAAPDQRISDLLLLTETERRQMLVEWNATEETYPQKTLHQLVEEQVDRSPDAVAVISENGSVTYRDLDCRANKIAHRLQAMGVGPEAILAVCLDRSIDMVAAFLGILKSGAAYLPVDLSYPADRIAYILQDACVSAVIASPDTVGCIPGDLAPVVILDQETLADQTNQTEAHPPATASPDQPAYVIYTSGSTGKPKGVVIEHHSIVNHVLWMRSRWPIGVGDAVLQCASASFDASVWEVWNALANGARLVIANSHGYADPGYLARRIIDHQVTHALIVPAVLELLAQHPDFPRCTSLRCLFPGGEALKHSLVQLIRSRRDLEIVNLYGPTETTINATFWVTGESEPTLGSIVPIGRPIANDRAYILDSNLNPVPIGVPGELHIAGASVGRGYLRRPELTAERFIPDPFVPGARAYKTGDVCRFRADGAIEYLGRNDRQVKVRGFRIELGEIEKALSEHKCVRQAAVIAREDAPGDVRLIAYLVPAVGDDPADADLRRFLRDRLPDYMVPAAFVVVPSLPLTSSGKLDVKALPVPDSLPRSSAMQYEAPRSEIESAIAAIWKDVLRVDKVGIHDNFFDLGGYSLLLIKVRASIEQHLHRKLEIVELFQYPTIETLAHRLTSQEDISSKRDRIRRQADRQKQAAKQMRRAALEGTRS